MLLSVTLRYKTNHVTHRVNSSVHPSNLVCSCQDYQFYIQNFTALQLGIMVPPSKQATFEYSFIPAEPMGGRPFGLVINLNYKDGSVSRLLEAQPTTS